MADVPRRLPEAIPEINRRSFADAANGAQSSLRRQRDCPIVIANHEQWIRVTEQLRQAGIQPTSIVLEPASGNTAPAIAVAAMLAMRNGDDLLFVLPSDQVIRIQTTVAATARAAAHVAGDNWLVTFGVPPTEPHTGYGYICVGAQLADHAPAFAVDAIIEKPDLDTARLFLQSGGHYWNSSMFVLKASTCLRGTSSLRPRDCPSG